MITYILTDGKQIVLPIDANEILHSRFCDARACEKAFFLLPESEQTEAIHAQMIIDYVGIMVDNFDDTMPFGELRQIKEGMLGFGKEVTVCRVYGHLLAVINAVKEPTFPIIIKETLPDGTTVDSEFTLASTIDDYALGGGQFTAGEVIESLIYEQALSDPKNQGDGFNYLHQANIDFDLDLTVIAHILRKPGEKLPFNTLERARFVNERKQDLGNSTRALTSPVPHRPNQVRMVVSPLMIRAFRAKLDLAINLPAGLQPGPFRGADFENVEPEWKSKVAASGVRNGRGQR